MGNYKVKALYLSGKNKKVHRAGEKLSLEEIPGGQENADELVKKGFIVELKSTSSSQKELATDLIEQSNAAIAAEDLVLALELAQQAVEAYPKGKTAPKLVKEIEDLLAGE